MKKSGLFIAAIVFAVAIRLVYVAVLPLGEIVRFHLEGLNDEPAHYNYVKYLVEKHAFPVQTHIYKEPGAFVRNDFEYYHPPVYYLLGGVGEAVLGPQAGLYWCRALSFCFGALSLFVLAALFRKMGYSSAVQSAAVLFVGFLPCHAYFSSLASNDSLCWLIALLLTYACLGRHDKSGGHPVFTWRQTAALGALLGIGVLAKASLLLFYPLIAAIFLYTWVREKKTATILQMLLLFGIDGPEPYGVPFDHRIDLGQWPRNARPLAAHAEGVRGLFESLGAILLVSDAAHSAVGVAKAPGSCRHRHPARGFGAHHSLLCKGPADRVQRGVDTGAART